MSGLDFYYAAEGCNAEKAATEKGIFYRISSRNRTYLKLELDVFGLQSKTELLMLAPKQIADFKKHYNTIESRFHLLPPGINKDKKYSNPVSVSKAQFLKDHGISDDNFIILQVGSDFKRKGVDRSLKAIASLPDKIKQKLTFLVVGQDDPKKFIKLSKELNIESIIKFYPGRNDINIFMRHADILLHPAYHEAAGIVILESICSGLPVIVTENCGYAHFVKEANCGAVLDYPFNQKQLNDELYLFITSSKKRSIWSGNSKSFSDQHDIYNLHRVAANIICAKEVKL